MRRAALALILLLGSAELSLAAALTGVVRDAATDKPVAKARIDVLGQELSTAIFLTSPKTRVMSVLILDLSEEGRLEPLAALFEEAQEWDVAAAEAALERLGVR